MPIWKEKKEKLKDKMSATRAKHNCECRLDGIGTGVSALMMGVCVMRSSVAKMRKAIFWAVSAVGRKSSHEFKQGNAREILIRH